MLKRRSAALDGRLSGRTVSGELKGLALGNYIHNVDRNPVRHFQNSSLKISVNMYQEEGGETSRSGSRSARSGRSALGRINQNMGGNSARGDHSRTQCGYFVSEAGRSAGPKTARAKSLSLHQAVESTSIDTTFDDAFTNVRLFCFL